MKQEFGIWLLEILEERGWAQSELCLRAQIESGTLSNIISGRRGIGPDKARAIARGLRIPEGEVFRRAGLMTEGRLTDEAKILRELEEKIGTLTTIERHKLNLYIDFVHFSRKRGDNQDK